MTIRFVLVGLALLATACGGDAVVDPSPATAPTTAPTTAVSPPATTSAPTTASPTTTAPPPAAADPADERRLEIDDGSVAFSLADSVPSGGSLRIEVCVTRTGAPAAGETWHAELGTDATSATVTTATAVLDDNGCAVLTLEVAWPGGSGQEVRLSDGSTTWAVGTVDITGYTPSQ